MDLQNKIQYLNEKQVSNLTGFALSTLRNDRHKGQRLPYIRAGRAIRYDLRDVVRFMDCHKIEPSNE